MSENDALPEVLSELAHELRSPLMLWSALLRDLREDPRGATATDAREKLIELAERGLLRLLRMSDRMSLTARLSSGSLTLASAPLEVGPLVTGASQAALAIERRSAITLELRVRAELPPASGDAKLLAVAIGELIAAALRGARSRVVVEARREGAQVLLRIEDDGGPLTPEDDRAVGVVLARGILAMHAAEVTASAGGLEVRLSGGAA